jgi:hypothetical protein
MTIRTLLLDIVKLIVAGAAFAAGIVLGGMLATMLQLPLPTPPPDADMSTVGLYMMLTTPLIALGAALLARNIAGGLAVRALVLSSFLWITYAVNTQLEAAIVSTYALGIPYALVMYLVASLLCGTTVALLFKPATPDTGVKEPLRAYRAGKTTFGLVWRLALAAVAFMPIYYAFGLMVLPFTGEYYRQNMFGLVAPTLESLLPTLFTRSVLFLVACLPVIVLWQRSDRALFWRLGLSLYLMVGGIIMLYSTWLPLYVRIPHLLEIFADEFVYAGVLVLLLGPRRAPAE